MEYNIKRKFKRQSRYVWKTNAIAHPLHMVNCMMTHELALDQQRIEAQDAIAQIYFIAGESDGYQGTFPQQKDYEYLSGYVMGVWRYRAQEISLATGECVVPF